MPDLRRQLLAAQRERDALRIENADLRAAAGWIDPEYAATLRLVAHLALHGSRRGTGPGPVDTGVATSRPPAHSSWAYDQLRKQRAAHRDLSRKLRHAVSRHMDDGRPEERSSDAEAPQPVRDIMVPQRATPSQTADSQEADMLLYGIVSSVRPNGAPTEAA